MSSKARGGLSKREYAAAQKAKVTTPKKSTSAPKAASSSSSIPAGAIGTNKDGGYIMSDGSVKYAASSATNPQAMNYQPQASMMNYTPAKKSSSKKSSSPSSKGVSFTEGLTQGRNALGTAFGAATDAAKLVKSLPQINGPATAALKLADAGMRGLRPYLGINVAEASNGDGIDYSKTLGLDDYFQDGQQEEISYNPEAPNASFLDPSRMKNSSQMSDMPAVPQVPQAVDENADVWNPAPARNRGLGGGGFGGGSMGMMASQSGSLSAPKNNDAEKYFGTLRDQSEEAFQDLIESLAPTYQGYKDEYETELQKSLMEERNALLGRQMAYGTADSEQRDQAEARLANEFADKRSSFLKRLAEQESGQRASLGYDFAQSQQDMGMKQWQMMQQQAQQQFENDLAMLRQRSSGSRGGYSQEDINNWLDDQAQTAVDYGMTGGAREGIARRAAQMFGGTPNNYINFFPNQWESGYTARPKITYKVNSLTGETEVYDAYGKQIQ